MNNNIEDDYCSFEVSKLLKEKGFNLEIIDYYLNDEIDYASNPPTNWNKNVDTISRPTYSLAIKWIRENSGFDIYVVSESSDYSSRIVPISLSARRKIVGFFKELLWNDSNKLAVEAALLYTLKNLI